MVLVAKSYQGLKQIGEPFMVGKKNYIKVETAKGDIKQVRAYSEAEYKSYYGEDVVDPYYKTQREVLGFVDGFITIFKGDTFPYKEWFKSHGGRFNRSFGWFFGSNIPIPEDIPFGIEPVRIDWDKVGRKDDTLLPDEKVKEVVNAAIYTPDDSEYFGTIGERVELNLVVEKSIPVDGNYSESTIHVFKDDKDNTFVWTTSAKCWGEGEIKHVRATIKDHKIYRNSKQTILKNVREVK